MQRNEKPADLCGKLDAVDHRLYQITTLCTFIADIVSAAPPKAQVDQVQANTLGTVFQFLADHLEETSEALSSVRTTVTPAIIREMKGRR